jgi:putative pyruvate formate lyase activating enzyme
VFFSGCALGCVYCQNSAISKGLAGKVITIGRLADIFLELQCKGANNINLVTPSPPYYGGFKHVTQKRARSSCCI